MPSTKQIQTSLSALPSGPPLVVAIIGGTTGIGSYTARAYARTYASQGSKLRVYLVGRNATRAAEILEYARSTSPGSDWRFLEVKDLSLMSEVDACVKRIEEMERKEPFQGKPRLDALYMSAALSPLQPSPATEEGIDTQLSLLYYSRIRFAQKLTPLLLASPQTAHVISIFAGSIEDKFKTVDAAIGKPDPYGVTTVRTNATFMKTFMFEELAKQHAGKISYTHIYPGLVDGQTFYSDVNPRWFILLWKIMKPLLSWYMTPPEVCGDVMVSLATERYPAQGSAAEGPDVATSTQNERGGGAYGVGQRGDATGKVAYAHLRKDDTAKKVWDHTMGVLSGIESKNAAA